MTLAQSALTDTYSKKRDPLVLKAKQQLGSSFGCFPLSTVQLFTGEPTHSVNIPDIIQVHKLVRQSGLPIFLGLRIPIHTQLNVSLWRYYLKDCFDQQLPDLIQFGFPLDFDWTCTLGITVDNHNLANMYPGDINRYIQEELSYQALKGPFMFFHSLCISHPL